MYGKEKETIVTFARWLMPRLGFSYNAKCDWLPKQIVKFLGFLIDTAKYEARVPDAKLAVIKLTISELINAAAKQQCPRSRWSDCAVCCVADV
jgi:hypothetical protein